MKDLVLYVGLFVYLCLTKSVAHSVGISQVGTSSSILLMLVFLQKISPKSIVLIKNSFREFFNLFQFCIWIILFFLIIGRTEVNNIIFSFIVPSCVFFLLIIQNNKNSLILKNIILVFFLLECLLSLYERSLAINVFPYEVLTEEEALYNVQESWMFRSSSLFGHPLNNALCVSIIMAFIICSKESNKLKIGTVMIGFVSLLCFNARGALILWTIIGTLYYISMILEGKSMAIVKILRFIAFGIVVSIVVYLMYSTSLGGRLFNESKVLDGSALTRIDAFSFMTFISWFDFFFGNSANYLFVMKKLGAGGVENSFIVFILEYGFIITCVLLYLLYKIMKKVLRPYSLQQKSILVLAFVGVGSLNNSLAIPEPWMVFFVCLGVFYREKYLEHIG